MGSWQKLTFGRVSGLGSLAGGEGVGRKGKIPSDKVQWSC